MDNLKHIQRSIIAGAISEGAFQKVSFLEKRDFDAEFQTTWSIILFTKGNLKETYRRLMQQNQLNTKIFKLFMLADYTNIDTMAFMLLEVRFREYLTTLLRELSLKAESATEGLILAQTIEEVETNDMDVFDLIEGMPEYLEPHCSEKVVNRFRDLSNYVTKRCEKIKQITHEPKAIH